jgi:hypothetical protein
MQGKPYTPRGLLSSYVHLLDGLSGQAYKRFEMRLISFRIKGGRFWLRKVIAADA